MSLSRRAFAKEFKEGAVRRLELRAPVARVARAYELKPRFPPQPGASSSVFTAKGGCTHRWTAARRRSLNECWPYRRPGGTEALP
jgi:hypothetical protein